MPGSNPNEETQDIRLPASDAQWLAGLIEQRGYRVQLEGLEVRIIRHSNGQAVVTIPVAHELTLADLLGAFLVALKEPR